MPDLETGAVNEELLNFFFDKYKTMKSQGNNKTSLDLLSLTLINFVELVNNTEENNPKITNINTITKENLRLPKNNKGHGFSHNDYDPDNLDELCNQQIKKYKTQANMYQQKQSGKVDRLTHVKEQPALTFEYITQNPALIKNFTTNEIKKLMLAAICSYAMETAIKKNPDNVFKLMIMLKDTSLFETITITIATTQPQIFKIMNENLLSIFSETIVTLFCKDPDIYGFAYQEYLENKVITAIKTSYEEMIAEVQENNWTNVDTRFIVYRHENGDIKKVAFSSNFALCFIDPEKTDDEKLEQAKSANAHATQIYDLTTFQPITLEEIKESLPIISTAITEVQTIITKASPMYKVFENLFNCLGVAGYDGNETKNDDDDTSGQEVRTLLTKCTLINDDTSYTNDTNFIKNTLTEQLLWNSFYQNSIDLNDDETLLTINFASVNTPNGQSYTEATFEEKHSFLFQFAAWCARAASQEKFGTAVESVYGLRMFAAKLLKIFNQRITDENEYNRITNGQQGITLKQYIEVEIVVLEGKNGGRICSSTAGDQLTCLCNACDAISQHRNQNIILYTAESHNLRAYEG